MDPSIEEISVRIVRSDEVVIKESSIPGAGNGIFAKKNIPAGTVIPYYTIVKIVDSPDFEKVIDTYFMTVTYMNSKGRYRTIGKLIADGNPDLPGIKVLRNAYRVSAFANESPIKPPNCIFVNNPAITKDKVYECLANNTPMVSTLLVVPRDIKRGEELFTLYGSDYDRSYKVWRDRGGQKDELIGLSHDIVEFHKDKVCSLFHKNK